jgi:hypothetical protein
MKTKNLNQETSEPTDNQQSYFYDPDGYIIFLRKTVREKENNEHKTFRFTTKQLAEFKKQDEKEEEAELKRLRLIWKNGPGKNIHIYPCGEKWGIKSEGDTRFFRIYKTKREAWRKGMDIARNRHSEFFEHRRTGRVLVWKTYPSVRRDTRR